MRIGRAGEPPTPEEIGRWQRRVSPPENELPAGVGLTLLLGHTGEAAVGVTQVEAFTNGFRFTLAVRLRARRPEFAHGGLHALVGRGHPHVEVPLADRLLLGIGYADGRRASTMSDRRLEGVRGTPGEDELMLSPSGGSSSDLSADQTYWVSPLPPEGPVTFVLAWESFGLPESQTTVDSAPIRAAAEQSHVLWPWQPFTEPPQPPPPPRPSSGWFADPEA